MSVRTTLGSLKPAPTEGWMATLLLAIVSAVVAAGVAIHLREAFGPLRLGFKSAVPFAIMAPILALVPSDTGRRLAASGAVVAMVATTWACVAVFGLPLQAGILVPFLGLDRIEFTPLVVAAIVLATAVALRPAHDRGPLRGLRPSSLLLAGAESVYFVGFLLTSTASLGVASWTLVGGGVLLAAISRGVSPRVGVAGAAAFVAMGVWSSSPYAAGLVHLAALSPTHVGPWWNSNVPDGTTSARD